MVKFSPDPNVVTNAETTGDFRSILTSNGEHQWLVLLPNGGRTSATTGRFLWVSNREERGRNTQRFYQYAEGIDVKDGVLYFTTKKSRSLFVLKLDMTYKRSSTTAESFDGQPDQITRLTDLDSKSFDLIFFCEDSRSNGIHARDREGNHRTILEQDGRYIGSEATGLAFSPDNEHMYFAMQDVGFVFDVTRKDGLAFNANVIDVKYHTWL